MNILAPSVEASQQIMGSTIRLILIKKQINKVNARQVITNEALIIFFVVNFFISKFLKPYQESIFSILKQDRQQRNFNVIKVDSTFILNIYNSRKINSRNQDCLLIKVKSNLTTFDRYTFSTMIRGLHRNQRRGLGLFI